MIELFDHIDCQMAIDDRDMKGENAFDERPVS